MSNPTYHGDGPSADRPLVWLHGEVKTPPFSPEARRRAGFLLRLLQQGVTLTMPDSRPMPAIGPRCHELRIVDAEKSLTWRLIYRIDPDAIILAEIFAKKTRTTPRKAIENAARRLTMYDRATR
jgi:phage-related protein